MPKLHLRAAGTDAELLVSACGWMGSRLTDDLESVSCARCRRLAARGIAEELLGAPDAATAAACVTRYGARDVTRYGARAIERSRRGEAPEGRGWPSPEAAVRAWVRDRAEGASMRSTTDPDRAHRVQHSRDPSLGGREHATIDRHRNTSVALDRATADASALARACPPLTPSACREVYLLRVCGRPVQRAVRRGNEATKQRVTEWVGMRVDEVAELASERWSVEVTARHVALVTRHFSAVVGEALSRSGELRRDAKSEGEGELKQRGRAWDPSSRLRSERGHDAT